MNTEIMLRTQSGWLYAIRAVLQALIASHPDRDAFLSQYNQRTEENIALMLGQSQSEIAIDAFRDFLVMLGIDQEQ